MIFFISGGIFLVRKIQRTAITLYVYPMLPHIVLHNRWPDGIFKDFYLELSVFGGPRLSIQIDFAPCIGI